MLSPLLFFIFIDYVVRLANEGSHGGILREIFSSLVDYLDDLDYTYDLAILACTLAASCEMLQINAPKTKVMCINTPLGVPLTDRETTSHSSKV